MMNKRLKNSYNYKNLNLLNIINVNMMKKTILFNNNKLKTTINLFINVL
jgi:hypothetical protein